MPSDWIVDFNIYNTEDFALPHKRPRVYVTGRKASLASLESFPEQIKPFQQRAFVRDIVDLSVLSQPLQSFTPWGHCGRGYSSLQRSNLRQWKAALSPELSNNVHLGQYIFIAYDRTPSSRTVWVPSMSWESCECLTACGPVLHCLSLGDNGHSRDSSVLPSERAALQGFPLGYIENDNKYAEASKAVGNAMSVPVVASVCFRELKFQLKLRRSIFVGDGASQVQRIEGTIMEMFATLINDLHQVNCDAVAERVLFAHVSCLAHNEHFHSFLSGFWLLVIRFMLS